MVKYMKKNRFQLVPGVALILKKDNQILLHKRKNTGYADDQWAYFGGGVDGNETIRQAAIREAKEEAGIIIQEEDIDVVHVKHAKHKAKSTYPEEYLIFYLEATIWNGTPQIMEPEKCDEIKWFDLDNLPENLLSKHILALIKDGKIYSEQGW
jgi:8-oxo-dGTP diphosphatase